MKESVIWAEVSCVVPADLVDQLAEFLVTHSGTGVSIENLAVDTFSLDTLEDAPVKTVKTYFIRDAALHDRVAAIAAYLAGLAASYPGFVPQPPEISYLQEEDWANNWKIHFKQSRIGRRLVIKPTWEACAAQPDDVIIELDPGMAFGTGTHPTSRLCLETLERIFFREAPFTDADASPPSELLDVGTGSGILAIAAAKFGADRVTAIDIDPDAVAVAQQNLELNRVQGVVAVSAMPLGEVAGTFAVVVANILAEELVRMGSELVGKLKRDGFLVLSGILTEKEGIVLEGFARFPLVLVETTREAEWSCITYRRKG
jgi:ribosomal protein L11 methyltransferase